MMWLRTMRRISQSSQSNRDRKAPLKVRLRNRAALTVLALTAMIVLMFVILPYMTPASPSSSGVSPDATGALNSHLRVHEDGHYAVDAPLVLTRSQPIEDGEFIHSFPVVWLTSDRPQFPIEVLLRSVDASEGAPTTTVNAELREFELVFGQLPRGLFDVEDIKSRVLFPPHAVHSDGMGDVALGTRARVGIQCAAAARVEVRADTAAGLPDGPAIVRVSWSCDLGKRGRPWVGAMDVPVANGAPAALALPRLQTAFVVDPDSGYAFESGFSYDHGVPQDGEVIQLRLLRCGMLIARIRERSPGDFVAELDRQFDGWFSESRYPLQFRVSTGLDNAAASTPGAGLSVNCDRTRAERIGSGTEDVRIPFLPTQEPREVFVTVSAAQIVASTRLTILPGVYEQAVWLDAVSCAWEVRVIAEGPGGTPVEGVTVELSPSVWTKPRSAIFIGPTRSGTTDKHGVAKFASLPFMPGVFMTLRIDSSYTVLDAPHVIEAPQEPAPTLVHIRLDTAASQNSLLVRLEIPEGVEGASNWLKGQVQYALLLAEPGGGNRTWDGAVSLDGGNTFTVTDAPPGDYTVVVTGPFGVATASGQVSAADRVFTLTVAPRVHSGLLLRDNEPIAGAVVFPLLLTPDLVRTLAASGAHGKVALGQRATDEKGRFSLLHSGDASPEQWGYYHKELGVFSVIRGEPATDGRTVLHFEMQVNSGSLVLNFAPSGDGTLPSSIHITPVISEDDMRTILDFAWGMTLPVKDADCRVDDLPVGRYMVLVIGKSRSGTEQVLVTPEWKQLAVIEHGRTTSLTFPYID